MSYLGCALRVARLETKVGRRRLAKYLGLDRKEIVRFEHGRDVLSQQTATRLFAAGIKYLEQNKE
jgi:plasmid maintenance system antidote protein VapI